jgi:hypothetical protein
VSAAITHVTIGFPVTADMKMLEHSARINGFQSVSHPKHWADEKLRTIDKISIMKALIESGQIGLDQVVLFTDAYDTLIIEHATNVLHKFVSSDADLLFSAEKNLYPWQGRDEVKAFFERFDSKWRFLNSGGYIGYGWAIRDMVDHVSRLAMAHQVFDHSLDQALAQEYFISRYNGTDPRVKIDTACRIFGTLIFSAADFELSGKAVVASGSYNNVSILHANGTSDNNIEILRNFNGLYFDHDMPVDFDLRVCQSQYGYLAYQREQMALAWSSEADERLVWFVSRGARRAVSFTMADGCLTFTPDLNVHAGTKSVLAWERLQTQAEVKTAHGHVLSDYIKPRFPGTLRLAPRIPLALLGVGGLSRLINNYATALG